jgi:hypothetical protein
MMIYLPCARSSSFPHLTRYNPFVKQIAAQLGLYQKRLESKRGRGRFKQCSSLTQQRLAITDLPRSASSAFQVAFILADFWPKGCTDIEGLKILSLATDSYFVIHPMILDKKAPSIARSYIKVTHMSK